MDDREDFIGFMALTKRLSETTIKLYLLYYDRFSGKPLNQQSINQFAEECGNNKVVRGFIKAYISFKGMQKELDLPSKPTGKKRIRVFRPISQDEIDAVSNYLHRESFQKGILFDLVYQGALRKVEVPTIKINSFMWKEWDKNPEQFMRLIVLGKYNKERFVLINPETCAKILMHFIQQFNIDNPEKLDNFYRSSSLLFDTTLPKIYKLIKFGSIKALNGRDIRPHELRHQRATELEKRGIPVQDIKVYLGHSNLTTTENYLHKTEKEAIDNIADKMSA